MTTLPRNDDGTLQSYAWPGGYPIYYICKDNSVLCPKCANAQETEDRIGLEDNPEGYFTLESEQIVAAEINYENSSLWCDECSERIESAYAKEEVRDGQQ